MTDSSEELERRKYTSAWSDERYRARSPGLIAARNTNLISVLRAFGVRTVLDAGCGRGLVMRHFMEAGDGLFQVFGMDIAGNARDPWFADAPDGTFTTGCLWNLADYPRPMDAIFCADVMEHIPTDKVDAVLSCFRSVARKVVFLSINLLAAPFELDGLNEPQHLTVRPPGWWLERIALNGLFVNNHMLITEVRSTPSWLYALAVPMAPLETDYGIAIAVTRADEAARVRDATRFDRVGAGHWFHVRPSEPGELSWFWDHRSPSASASGRSDASAIAEAIRDRSPKLKTLVRFGPEPAYFLILADTDPVAIPEPALERVAANALVAELGRLTGG